MQDQISVGQMVTLRAVFISSSGAAADPTTVSIVVTSPSGSATTYTYAANQVTKDSVGHYSVAVTVGSAGVWSYEWTSTGNPTDSQAGRFLVGDAGSEGPCDSWVMPDEIFSYAPLDSIAAASRDYTLAVKVVDAASRLLYRLTRSRYPGICESTVRPCRRSSSWGTPSMWNATWGDCSCGSSSLRQCGCGGVSEVILAGEYPLLGIERVRVDGATLSSSTYRIDDDHYLVRTDGNVWPLCQDIEADPASDANTWDVTFWWGRPVPPDGAIAAAHLAAQLYANLKGLDCSLPATMRSRTLQGVTEELITVQDLEDGKFGIREVDWFLNAERLAEQRRPTIVASPDFLPTTTRTGTRS